MTQLEDESQVYRDLLNLVSSHVNDCDKCFNWYHGWGDVTKWFDPPPCLVMRKLEDQGFCVMPEGYPAFFY